MKILCVKPHCMSGRVASKKNMSGTGMGSVLLHGSSGVAGTYTSDSPTVGEISRGTGLGKDIAAKLDKLKLQSRKKPENISFNF